MLFLWLFAKSLEDTLGTGSLPGPVPARRDRGGGGRRSSSSPTRSCPSVGVAGAIAGLIGAYALLYPRARILCWVLIPFFVTFVEIPALILAAVWFALQALDAVGQPPLAGLAAGSPRCRRRGRLLARGRATITGESSEPVY